MKRLFCFKRKSTSSGIQYQTYPIPPNQISNQPQISSNAGYFANPSTTYPPSYETAINAKPHYYA